MSGISPLSSSSSSYFPWTPESTKILLDLATHKKKNGQLDWIAIVKAFKEETGTTHLVTASILRNKFQKLRGKYRSSTTYWTSSGAGAGSEPHDPAVLEEILVANPDATTSRDEYQMLANAFHKEPMATGEHAVNLEESHSTPEKKERKKAKAHTLDAISQLVKTMLQERETYSFHTMKSALDDLELPKETLFLAMECLLKNKEAATIFLNLPSAQRAEYLHILKSRWEGTSRI